MRHWDVITAVSTSELRSLLNSIERNGHTIFSVLPRSESQYGEFNIVSYVDCDCEDCKLASFDLESAFDSTKVVYIS